MSGHPAVYNNALLPVMAEMLIGCRVILDPFGGTGKVKRLAEWLPGATIVAGDIEPEWGFMSGLVLNAVRLPFRDGAFDGACTSPCYGNRMADHFRSQDPNRVEHTYRAALGRDLNPENAGRMKWGPAYCGLHRAAWAEVARVLQPGGTFVLNCKDHIRAGQVQRVTLWHLETLLDLGFVIEDWRKVRCLGNRHGSNFLARVEQEDVVKLRLRGERR